MLAIARVFYPVTVLGPGNRIGIWTAGCNKNCRGCISPDLKNEENGIKMSTNDIIELINKIDNKVDGITISGGEPFLYPLDLLDLVIALEKVTPDIIVFSGYNYDFLLQNKEANEVLQHISVLIDGVFDDTKKDKHGLRGSTNQQIIVFRNQEKYCHLEYCDREIQTVLYKNKLLSIGIP